MKIVHLCLCGAYNIDWGYQDNMIPKYNKRDGHNVTVVTSVFVDSTKKVEYEKVSPGEYFSKYEVKIIRIPFKRSIFPFLVEKLRIYENLYETLEKEQPDFIFIHNLQFIDLKTVVKYVKNHPKCRVVADLHATYDNSAKNFISKYILHKIIWRSMIKSALPYIKKVFAVTPACKKFAVEMYKIPEEKIDYLYLGAETEKINFEKQYEIRSKIRSELNITESDFVLVTGGKLNRGKRVDFLVDVFKELKDEKLKLIIFGKFIDDIEKEMLNYIQSDERIRYVGWIESDKVYDYYLASDTAIFLGTKSVLWEQAVACGLPMVLKKWDGMEYVDVGGNCIFVNGEDKWEVVESIKRVLYDKNLYEQMKQVAREKGFSTFSYENISRKAISI